MTKRKLSEKQWRAAVSILMDCLTQTQTQFALVMNDPENPKHHITAVTQFNDNADMIKFIHKRIGVTP